MVVTETDTDLLLTGVVHRFTGLRWPLVDGDVGELRDRAVIVTTTDGGAMLSELDRLALARWLLAGMPYSVEELPQPEDDESGYDGP